MTAKGTQRRVVITGVGPVSAIGVGKEAFWNSLRLGVTGIDFLKSIPHDELPSKFAAEVSDFDPLDYLHCRKFIKVMSRDIQLGVAAASLSVRDAKLKDGSVDPTRLGVSFGAGRISIRPEDLAEAATTAGDGEQFEFTRWGEDSMGQIAPLWFLKRLPNMPACHVAIAYNAQGPNNTITSRDSSPLLALSEAVNVIQRGTADCMIVGACSSSIHPVDIAKLTLFENLSRRDDDPQKACRPFDKQRDGTILGEGAAAFILEDYAHAVRRGAEIYAEILSVGLGCDGRGYNNGTGGRGLVNAIAASLHRAEIEPTDVGHVNAHGKSTQRDDLVESRAYRTAFGDCIDKIPVTALKSYFGHFDAGSGAVELAGSLMALKNGLVPATLNYEIPDPRCRLNVVHGEPSQLRTSTAVSVNRTAMGQSAAAVIRAI